jgi:hypothetical protein
LLNFKANIQVDSNFGVAITLTLTKVKRIKTRAKVYLGSVKTLILALTLIKDIHQTNTIITAMDLEVNNTAIDNCNKCDVRTQSNPHRAINEVI